jgi:hypothetical protein
MFLLRIILFFIIISFLVRIVGRVLFFFTPKNIKENRTYDSRKEGEVTVQSNNSNKKKINKDLGEYVNYEEIDN